MDVRARLERFAAFARGRWRPFRTLAAPDSARLPVAEELAVRDVVTRYATCLDAGDLPALVALFDPDAILVNPRGTFAGRDAIERNFGWLIAHPRTVQHHVTNVLVRALGGDAWLTAYFQTTSTNASGELRWSAGSYAMRLRGAGAGWRIADMRISDEYVHLLKPGSGAAAAGAAGPPPEPTDVVSSVDWSPEPDAR